MFQKFCSHFGAGALKLKFVMQNPTTQHWYFKDFINRHWPHAGHSIAFHSYVWSGAIFWSNSFLLTRFFFFLNFQTDSNVFPGCGCFLPKLYLAMSSCSHLTGPRKKPQKDGTIKIVVSHVRTVRPQYYTASNIGRQRKQETFSFLRDVWYCSFNIGLSGWFNMNRL